MLILKIVVVVKRMVKYKPKAIELIGKSFLSEGMKDSYINVMEARYEQLYINDN